MGTRTRRKTKIEMASPSRIGFKEDESEKLESRLKKMKKKKIKKKK